MRKILVAALACVALWAAMIGPAEARFTFGEDDSIHFLQDVGIKSPDGLPLFLGFKTTTYNFLAGVYLVDDGYVLGVRSETTRYYDLPDAKTLADLQKRGLMPDPLPPYTIPLIDYIAGYSLWILVPVAILGVWFSDWRKKRALARDPFAGL